MTNIIVSLIILIVTIIIDAACILEVWIDDDDSFKITAFKILVVFSAMLFFVAWMIKP